MSCSAKVGTNSALFSLEVGWVNNATIGKTSYLNFRKQCSSITLSLSGNRGINFLLKKITSLSPNINVSSELCLIFFAGLWQTDNLTVQTRKHHRNKYTF